MRKERQSQSSSDPARQSRNTYLVGFSLIANGVLTTLLSVIAARVLGPSHYGRYGLIVYSITVGSIVCTLGIQAAVFRYGTEYVSHGKGNKFRVLVGFAQRLGLGFGLALGAVSVLLTVAGVHRSLHLTTLSVAIIGTGSIVAGLLSIKLYALRALDAVPEQAFAEKVLKPIVSLIGLGILFLVGYISAHSVAMIIVGGFAAALLYTWWLLQEEISQLPDAGPRTPEQKEWVRFSLPVFSDTLLQHIAVQGGIEFLLLAWLGLDAELGVYAVLFRVLPIVIMPYQAASKAFGPHAGYLLAEGKNEELDERLKETVVAILMVSAPLAALIISHGDIILSIFGPEYVEGTKALNIIIIGVVAHLATGECRTILLLAGRSREYLTLTVILVIVGVASGMVFIPNYGLVGAAVTGAVARIVYNIGSAIMVNGFLSVNPASWGSGLVILAAMASIGAVYVLRSTGISENPFVLIPVQIGLLGFGMGALAYLGLVENFYIDTLKSRIAGWIG